MFEITFKFGRRPRRKPVRWTDLDRWVPEIDVKRKIVDGKYFQSKKYLVVQCDHYTMTLSDPKIYRWVVRYLCKRWTYNVWAFTSDSIQGKLIHDRSHARRHIDQNRPRLWD